MLFRSSYHVRNLRLSEKLRNSEKMKKRKKKLKVGKKKWQNKKSQNHSKPQEKHVLQIFRWRENSFFNKHNFRRQFFRFLGGGALLRFPSRRLCLVGSYTASNIKQHFRWIATNNPRIRTVLRKFHWKIFSRKRFRVLYILGKEIVIFGKIYLKKWESWLPQNWEDGLQF